MAALVSAAEPVTGIYAFGKGVAIAAPQVGINRAAAIVRPPGGETITLLNPRIIEASTRPTTSTKAP